jgi:membrane protease YdiL (CAAX protease family)
VESSRTEGLNREVSFGNLVPLRPIPAVLSAIVAAEAILVFVSIPFGVVMHGLLFAGLLIAATGDKAAECSRCLGALSLVPLLRLLSFAVFGPTLPVAVWGVFSAMTFIIATILMARALAISAADLGWRRIPDVEVVLVTVTVAATTSAVASTVPGAFAPILGGPVIPVFLALSALGEELAFRGVLQSTIREAYGRQMAILVPQIPFVALYLGMYSGTFLIATTILGLTLAWATEQSRSLVPAILGHMVFSLAIAFVWPMLR